MLRFLVHPLSELLGVATILGGLVGTATLPAGEAGLLPAGLPSRGDVPLLLGRLAELLSLGLLAHPLLGRLLGQLLSPGLLAHPLLGRLLGRLLSLGLLAHPLLGRLLGQLLGLWLLILLGLLCRLLAALRGRQELAGLGVTRPLFGQVVHPLSELLGVATILSALVGTATLLTGEAGLLPAGLLGRGDVPLLCLWLLSRLLCLWLLGLRLLVRPLGRLSAQLLLLDRVLSGGLILETHW